MQKRMGRQKLCMYSLLAALTVLFACLSLHYFTDELVTRTMPQIMRTMVQVSRLLPQLEKNEQALRDVYADFETSRKSVHTSAEATVEKTGDNGENIDTIIDHTLSWMDRVARLRVGREGHVFVVSKDDYTILAHADQRFVGDELEPIDYVDEDSLPDISEIDEEYKPDQFHLFFPLSFYLKNWNANHVHDVLEAGGYGTAFKYKDTYIICGTSLREAFYFIVIRTFFTTLIFFAIAWIFVRYVLFSLGSGKQERKRFCNRLTAYAGIAVAVLFLAMWYNETIVDVTGDLATMNDHAQVAVDTVNTYRRYRDELSDWLDDQYLTQCKLAKSLVEEKGIGNLTRKDLANYAKQLSVEHIYVFDKNGKTVVTNAPFDHFTISDREGDQSYAFRPLLSGREYVIQEPMIDEMNGKMMQYIGVSLRDENDLSDGFIQIAIDPDLRERLLAPISVQAVLDNLVAGPPDHAIAIDKETMRVIGTTGLGFLDENIADLGIDEESVKKNFNGYYYISGDRYYAGVSESEDMYLMPLLRSAGSTDSFVVAMKLTLFCVVAFFLFATLGLWGFKRIAKVGEPEGAQDEGAEEAGDHADTSGLVYSPLSEKFEEKATYYFESRWKRLSAVPAEQMTPEARTRGIIYRMILFIFTAQILFEGVRHLLGVDGHQLDGFSYVLFGNWQKGINIFSFSYCLFLLCTLCLLQEVFNRILYWIAKYADRKKETILLLLRNALKYACALAFLYIGLAKFGIDTRALWASAGVLSLMIGFGAKDLVNDIIAGLFIIFEGTYKIGDFLLIGDWRGTVQEIGLRYTKIGYFSDTKIINNSAIRDFINCDGEIAKEVLMVPVAYEMDLREIEKLLERELPLISKRVPWLIRPLKYRGVHSFEESFMLLKINLYCVPMKRRKAARAFRRELKILFDRENIKIPYSHTVFRDYKDVPNTYTFDPQEK